MTMLGISEFGPEAGLHSSFLPKHSRLSMYIPVGDGVLSGISVSMENEPTSCSLQCPVQYF